MPATVFERLRGHTDATRRGLPLHRQLEQFRMLAGAFIVLPIDEAVAGVAAELGAHPTKRQRRALGDIVIAATGSTKGLPLASRNRRNFEP